MAFGIANWRLRENFRETADLRYARDQHQRAADLFELLEPVAETIADAQGDLSRILWIGPLGGINKFVLENIKKVMRGDVAVVTVRDGMSNVVSTSRASMQGIIDMVAELTEGRRDVSAYRFDPSGNIGKLVLSVLDLRARFDALTDAAKEIKTLVTASRRMVAGYARTAGRFTATAFAACVNDLREAFGPIAT